MQLHSVIAHANNTKLAFRHLTGLDCSFEKIPSTEKSKFVTNPLTYCAIYCILSSIMRIQLKCTPEFHNDFRKKKFFLFFKNNFTRINPCKFIHHKTLLSYLPCIVHREYFSIIFNVKKCALYSIKYGSKLLRVMFF